MLVLGLVVILSVQSGEALECHQCNSGKEYNQPDCADNFDPDVVGDTYLSVCPDDAEYIVCRKIKQDVDGEVRVVRSCGTAYDPEKTCVDRTGSDGIKVSYCECTDDGCNAAPHLLLSAPLLLLTLLSALASLLMHS